jgi:histidine triad (HIT) family protein
MSDYEANIFTKIIDGDVPCHRVYEDQHVLAFLDVGPLSRGHTLVVPKEHATHLHELSAEASAAVGRVLPRLCSAVAKAAGTDTYNVLVNTGREAGQAVMHVHFHIIPKFPDTGFKMGWDAGKLDDVDAKQLVEAMRKELG